MGTSRMTLEDSLQHHKSMRSTDRAALFGQIWGVRKGWLCALFFTNSTASQLFSSRVTEVFAMHFLFAWANNLCPTFFFFLKLCSCICLLLAPANLFIFSMDICNHMTTRGTVFQQARQATAWAPPRAPTRAMAIYKQCL